MLLPGTLTVSLLCDHFYVNYLTLWFLDHSLEEQVPYDTFLWETFPHAEPTPRQTSFL